MRLSLRVGLHIRLRGRLIHCPIAASARPQLSTHRNRYRKQALCSDRRKHERKDTLEDVEEVVSVIEDVSDSTREDKRSDDKNAADG